MSLTGYVTQFGIDLSYIFQPSTNNTIITGFKLINGQDIGSIFAAYTSVSTSLTGLISIDGNDLSTLFNGILEPFPFSIAGCCLWLDSTDLNTITKDGSNKVNKWVDKSENKFDFVQNTLTNQPTYSIDPSGNGIISFTSTNFNYLAGPNNFSIGTSSFSLFVVCSFYNPEVSGTVFAKSIAADQPGRFFILRENGNNMSISYFHGSSSLPAISRALIANTYYILELIVNRTEGIDYSFQNGTLLLSGKYTDTTNYTNSANLMLIGAYNNTATTPLSGYYLNGTVAEIVSYKSTDMSSMTRQRIEGYLAWKWGIQNTLLSTHAYRSASPPISISNTQIPLRVGLSLWLDSTDLSTITKTASNRVSKWVDKSANNFQFTQNTGENQPTYVENNQNGKATISFRDTSSNYLMGPNNFSIGTSSFALFAVCRFNTNNTTGTVFAKSKFAVEEGRFFIIREGTNLNIRYIHQSGSSLSTTTDSYPTGEYRILELIVNRIEQTDYSYQNGTQLTSLNNIVDTFTYTNNTNIMLIGAYNNSAGTGVQNGYYLNGNVAEIIAYKDAHIDRATRETIEGYLAWKWGLHSKLPDDHAYRFSAPT